MPGTSTSSWCAKTATGASASRADWRRRPGSLETNLVLLREDQDQDADNYQEQQAATDHHGVTLDSTAACVTAEFPARALATGLVGGYPPVHGPDLLATPLGGSVKDGAGKGQSLRRRFAKPTQRRENHDVPHVVFRVRLQSLAQ